MHVTSGGYNKHMRDAKVNSKLFMYNLSQPVLHGHPVLSGPYRGSRGFSLNTGFTVFQSQKMQKKTLA